MPGIVCSGRTQAATGDAWGSILLFLVWLFVKIVHGEDYTLFVCSLRSLPSSQPILPSHTHTASSDIKKVLVLDQLQAPLCHWLRTIWKSRAAQAFATMIDWRSDGVSSRRSTRKLDRRLSGTRTGGRCSGELRQATDRLALVDEEIIEVVTVYEQAREVQPGLQVTMVLWTLALFRTRLTKKHLFHNRKFAQLGLREVLTLQSNLSAKAAVGASMLCLQKQGQLSPGFVWEWWAGRRSVCQPRDDLPCCKADSWILWSCRFKRYACPNQLVCFRAQTTIASRYYHEFKQKLFDVVDYSVR